MFDSVDFDVKVQIIKTSDLEDAKILTEIYTQLIDDSKDSESKNKYIVLRSTANQRIQELAHS